MAKAGDILLNIEQAIGRLFRAQRQIIKGEEPREFFALSPKKIVALQGATSQGVPIVSLVLQSDVRLDFALDQTQVRELIEWLQGLEKDIDKPPRAPH